MNTKNIIFTALSLFAAGMVWAQAWTEAANLIPSVDTAARSGDELADYDWNDQKTNVINWIGSFKNSWNVYYPAVIKNTNAIKTENSLLLYAGKKDTYSAFSEAYTSFAVSAEVRGAARARLSFDLSYYGNETSVNIGLDVGDWDEGDIIIGMGAPVGTLASEPSGSFTFGLINLATKEAYSPAIGTDAYLFDFDKSGWFNFDLGEDGSITVSFELSAAELATITDAGLGLYIRAEKDTDTVEIYEVGNFIAEIVVPEPSTYAAILGALALALAVCRRKK